MLDTITPYVDSDKVAITNISETISRNNEKQEQLIALDTKIEDRKSEINKRINELEKEARDMFTYSDVMGENDQ